MKSKRIPRQRGHVMLESALTIVAFLSILIFVLDIGQVLFVHLSITERVRASLRYGVTRTYDAASIRNVVLYGEPTAPAGSSPSFSLDPAQVVVSRSNVDTPEDRIVVTVNTYSYEFFTPFLAGRRTAGPLSGSMTYEGVQ